MFSTTDRRRRTARPLAVSVAPLALAYDERSMQANIQHVEIPRRRSYILVSPGNGDAPGATVADSKSTGALRLKSWRRMTNRGQTNGAHLA